jgi:undecaprenyl diphosphate synthase
MSSSFAKIPTHVAIIMDGNGRWAHRQNKATISGHQAGAEALKRTCKAAHEIGIKYLTVYAFSTENWHRPTYWVDELMGLLRYYLKYELQQLIKNNIRLSIIGNRHLLSEDICTLIEKAEAETASNTGLELIMALSYGSRDELTHAAKLIAEKVKSDQLKIEDISQKLIQEHLYTSRWPDPDLLIRTSGEQRISNFLLWQLAYSELIFLDKLWPDFTGDDLLSAISEYNTRDRRYGAVIGT